DVRGRAQPATPGSRTSTGLPRAGAAGDLRRGSPSLSSGLRGRAVSPESARAHEHSVVRRGPAGGRPAGGGPATTAVAPVSAGGVEECAGWGRLESVVLRAEPRPFPISFVDGLGRHQ